MYKFKYNQFGTLYQTCIKYYNPQMDTPQALFHALAKNECIQMQYYAIPGSNCYSMIFCNCTWMKSLHIRSLLALLDWWGAILHVNSKQGSVYELKAQILRVVCIYKTPWFLMSWHFFYEKFEIVSYPLLLGCFTWHHFQNLNAGLAHCDEY